MLCGAVHKDALGVETLAERRAQLERTYDLDATTYRVPVLKKWRDGERLTGQPMSNRKGGFDRCESLECAVDLACLKDVHGSAPAVHRQSSERRPVTHYGPMQVVCR